MISRHLVPLRVLGVVHVLVGLLLLLLVLSFGLSLAPLLAWGPVWLMLLGYRLWRQGDQVGGATAVGSLWLARGVAPRSR